jgi:hypothetical protein
MWVNSAWLKKNVTVLSYGAVIGLALLWFAFTLVGFCALFGWNAINENSNCIGLALFRAS